MCARASEGVPDWCELQAAAWRRPRVSALARRRVAALAIALGLGVPAAARGDPCVPRLADVQAAAARHLALDERPRWRGRARWASLLPQLSLRGRAGLGWEEGGPATGSPIEVDHDQAAEVRLAWRLDRFLYHPDEPRLLDAERRARRLRVTSDQEVTRLYFGWRRAIAAAGEVDGVEAGGSARLDEAEAFAQVDALTGGWLARRVEGCR